MSFTDFKAGLQNANDYLDARHHLSGTTAIGSDALRVVGAANYSFSLKELICSILGGHGFKLPNIQICIFANLNALLGLDLLQAALKAALAKLADAFSSFMDALSIDSILGKLNSVLNEAINVANMINFCGAPINPVAIPNMLEQAFASLLGKGDAIINSIGIPPIDTCLAFDSNNNPIFNVDAFNGSPGIFGDIAANYAAIAAGTFSQSSTGLTLDLLVNEINSVTSEINSLLESENSVKGAYDLGGSDFTNISNPGGGGDGTGGDGCSTSLGVLHNPSSGTVADNTRIAASLKSAYDNLAGYPVQYTDAATGEVTEYPNIFHLFVSKDVLELLNEDDFDNSQVAEQVPVYDYCGNIIGYASNVLQGNADETSNGDVPSNVSCPGDPANYDPSNPTTSTIYPRTSPSTVTRDTTISSETSGSTASVDSETGFTSTETSGEESGGISSANSSRKSAGDTWFYHHEIEEYSNTSGQVEIRLERRKRGNYVAKHVVTVDKNTAIYFNDYSRKPRESGYFELMIEHISDFIEFVPPIIWDGGVEPTFTSGNYHVIEFRNFGGSGWGVTTNDSNYWMGKVVGSFPIPT